MLRRDWTLALYQDAAMRPHRAALASLARYAQGDDLTVSCTLAQQGDAAKAASTTPDGWRDSINLAGRTGWLADLRHACTGVLTARLAVPR